MSKNTEDLRFEASGPLPHRAEQHISQRFGGVLYFQPLLARPVAASQAGLMSHTPACPQV